jgi:hypothetical protein
MWPRHSGKQAWRDVAGKNVTSPHLTKPQIEAMYLHKTRFLLQLYARKHDTTVPHINLANSPCNSADLLGRNKQMNLMLRAKKQKERYRLCISTNTPSGETSVKYPRQEK